MPAFERVGVVAVVDGVEVYVRNARRVQGETDRMGAAATRAAGQSTAAARGAASLGRGFLYAAGSSGVLSSELSVLSASAATTGVATAGVAIAVGALVAALGASVKAAIDFEDSFAAIRKTVDATDDEFRELAKLNRQIALDLPLTVGEINRIGAIAGQLGINGVRNIAAFERVIAQLTITTGLSADELASALGKLVSVTGFPIEEVDRLGSALTDLGNKFNSTEGQILDFAVRFAGAAKVVGLPTGDVLAIANAFASVGVESERGGSAVQRVLLALQQAAATGGDELKLFAATIGVTEEQFRTLVRTDPTEAFVRFVEGLGAAGEDAFRVLEALGIADVRLTGAFLAAASAGDQLRRSIDTEREAALANNATLVETEKRLDTTAAQWQLFKNNVNDAAISVGNFFNPAVRVTLVGLNKLVDGLQSAGSAFGRVDDRVKAIAVVTLPLLLGPIGRISAGIIALGTDWSGVWGSMQTAAERAVNAILVVIEEMIRGIGEGVGGLRSLASNVPGARSLLDKAGLTSGLRDLLSNFELGRVEFGGSTAFPDVGARDAAQLAAAESAEMWARLVGESGDAAESSSFDIDRLRKVLAEVGDGAKGATRLEKIFDAIQDGVIDLSEAVELGLTDQEVVTLELAKVQADAAKDAFRLRIALLELATRFPGMSADGIKLAIALQAIQEHLRKTGQTIAQFIHDTAATALEGFRSALDALFSRPTRESLELRQRLAELELTRIRRQRAGATDEDLESLDAQIEQVNLLIQQREKEAELLKLKIQLENDAIQTDRDVNAQARLLGIAMAGARDQMREFEGAAFFDTLAHINAGNAANTLADSARSAANALNTITGASGGSTLQGQHGLVGDFGRGTPVVLHGREAVVPLEASPSREVVRAMPLIAGMGGQMTNVFSPSLTEAGMDMDAVRRQFHVWVDEWFLSSRSRSGRAGASVGSGIG